MGMVLFFLPDVMRRGTLFGVGVADSFRYTPEGRHVTGLYRIWVAIALAIAALLSLFWPTAFTTALSPLALFVLGTVAFFKARRLTLPFAIRRQPQARSMEMTPSPERLPRWTWLSAGPFLVLALSAAFLNSRWNSIPATFPVHYGLNGTPDRWAHRTFQSAYGPLILGAEIAALLLGLGLASWFGARRSALRPKALALILAAEYWLVLLFSATAVQPVLGFPVWIIVAFALCAPFLVIGYILRRSNSINGPRDSTPEDCWKYGVFYYNPNDAALFVEKRTGFGYTINFANHWSWAFFAGLILVIATIPAVVA
jgi:uncharacterized membrane protein